MPVAPVTPSEPSPLLFLLPSTFPTSTADANSDHSSENSNGSASLSHGSSKCGHVRECAHALLLPQWLPEKDSSQLSIAYHAIVYVIVLAYLLFGVSIITDRIVSAMEVIAAQKREITVKLKSGNTKKIKVPLWHPNVVALTVFAIGTSSPEIFVSVIEIFKQAPQDDNLGPSLIVGSGAYHLFVITGVCLFSVREQQAKPIQDRFVFFTSSFIAIIAYLWIWVLVAQISPGVIELWEALLTLLFFPVIVVTSWAVARRFPNRLLGRVFRVIRRAVSPTNSDVSSIADDSMEEATGDDLKRRKLAALLQQLKEDNPEKTQMELEELAEIQMLEDTPKSAAFYRLQTTKAISGGANVMSKERIKEKLEEQNRKGSSVSSGASAENTMQTVGFVTAQNTCIESCGTAIVTVGRWGAGIDHTTLSVDYETVEGTAKPNVNFQPSSGKVMFVSGQQWVDIAVTVLDDDIFDENSKFFKIRLSKPDLKYAKQNNLLAPPRVDSRNPSTASQSTRVSRVEVTTAETVLSILDDDHCGIFMFEQPEQAIPDNIDIAKIKVVRSVGTKGRIALPYRISPGTAKPQEDYFAPSKGVLHFDSGQFEAFIEVKIIDKNRIGEVFTFYIELLQPRKESPSDVKSTVGHPTLGNPKLVQIGICEDEELKDALDRLLKMTDLAEYVVSSTWKDQIREALTVFHDENYAPENTSPKTVPTYVKSYAIHFLSLPWKLLVALLPPARLLHGWVAYLSLLALMAFVATMIGDCASALGCIVGFKDTITAMTLIAFGMGLPDTFASRRAAIHEKTADAAIGHITGANAVSVFLGIGFSWTAGSLFRRSHGVELTVATEDLGFTIMLYCTFAAAGVIVLLLRRLPPVGGELGGPTLIRILSAMFFILLWVLFIGLTILESYCVIHGF